MARTEPVTLNTTQKCLLKVLSRVVFATLDQLAHWAKIKKPSASVALGSLSNQQLVSVSQHVKPYIIQITHAGARVAGVTLSTGKTFYSWAAKSHRVYRNDAEILLRDIKFGFAMQNRYYHYTLGLNPSHGEHGAVDADERRYFCLIDDYRMTVNRLLHAWQRRHTPNRDYYADSKGFRWKDLCHQVLVLSTDADHLQRYKDHYAGMGLPLDFYYLKPRWH